MTKAFVLEHIEHLLARYPDLGPLQEQLVAAFTLWSGSYHGGGKTLVCGNGGSAADSEHIVGELMKGFRKRRPVDARVAAALRTVAGADGDYAAQHLQMGLPAISLVSQTSLLTAFINDVGPDLMFAQQVLGYGNPGDILLGISTSGHAANINYALQTARALGMKTIGLAGRDGGPMKHFCDVCLLAPGQDTASIQERHIAIYHTLCALLEDEFFSE